MTDAPTINARCEIHGKRFCVETAAEYTLAIGLDKDFKELDDEAKGDLQKQFANFKKKAELNNEAYEKITKTLDDDQKKDFDKAGGEKFTLKLDFGFAKDKKKEKEKKDDQ